jgi:competence ComEA-like helix-hairpin-helix protein
MMKPRNLVLLLIAAAALIGPGTAMAADEPATTATTPTTTVDPSTTSDSSTDSAPLTLTQDEIDALQDANDSSDDNKSVFEKASDFVTENAPWFIIGIIVLAAIIAGILIMRGRPRKAKGGTPKASKSNKAMRQAGGVSATGEEPAQVPSPSELRRRKRAAVQRSREEERARRKAGIENRKAVRRGETPVAPVAATVAGAGAVAATGMAAGGLDPVEAEKQSARDQETAAAAMARYGAVEAPLAEPPLAELPAPQTVPAPVSPSQTAPAAGVVTPYSASTQEPYAETAPEPAAELEPAAEYAEEPTEDQFAPAPDDTFYETPAALPEPEAPYAAPEAETSILHEPSIENPGPDATVGNAAEAFLAGGAAGAAGGLAAARASRSESPEPEPAAEPLEPVIAPEPGMAAEHALADPDPILPVEAGLPSAEPIAGDADAAAAEERLRAKVAEIKASQQPQPPTPAEQFPAEPEVPGEPAPLGPDADLSPGLAAVERRLSENSTERDRALRDAEERLRRVEQRAEDAERRAAFAERLAQLKVEESEREKRLNDVVSGIDRAEQRAREAEARAEAAERAAAAALEQSDLKAPPAAAQPAAEQAVPESAEPVAEPAPSPEPESPEPPAPAAPEPERKGLFGGSSPAAEAGSDSVNLNSATFEQLRDAGLSVTQATRILAYRERFGGYNSVEDLEKVPGFPSDLIESLKGKISV